MASLHLDSAKNGYRLSFRCNGRKTSIWLGAIKPSRAEYWKTHVEHLLESAKAEEPPSKVTNAWMRGLSDAEHSKLAKRGLVVARKAANTQQIALGAWFDTYIAERTDIKGSTKETYQKAKDCLVAYFGASKPIRSITAADAKRWRIWLATSGNRRDKNRKSMADATVRRRVGKAKQFFNEALERGLVDENPFAKLPSAVSANTKRQYFVPADWIESCIKLAPDTDWRTLLALSRYGGLRCPSEVLTLKWTNVNLPESRMTIHAPKTEHHGNGGDRVCPIFPELRLYLEAAWDVAPEGAVYVVHRYGGRGAATNLRTYFESLILQAGLVQWPKLFQNLRASRETELMALYPAKDVASWLGNSVPVAMAHYAMATAESFQKAVAKGAKSASDSAAEEGGAKSGAICGSIKEDSAAISSRQAEKKTPISKGKAGF